MFNFIKIIYNKNLWNDECEWNHIRKNWLNVNSWGEKLWKFFTSAFLVKMKKIFKITDKYVIESIVNRPIIKLVINVYLNNKLSV